MELENHKFKDKFSVNGEFIQIKKTNLHSEDEVTEFMRELNNAKNTMIEIRKLEEELRRKKERYLTPENIDQEDLFSVDTKPVVRIKEKFQAIK